MGFDKIEAVSLTDQFVQKIESMIISGELMPGDQLPAARELSAGMGVSRSLKQIRRRRRGVQGRARGGPGL